MSKKHDHDHAHALLPPEPALRVQAIETLLVEKGLVDSAAVDAIVDAYSNDIGPRNGALVVARAWTDPEYLDRLRKDATSAISELGFSGMQGEHMVAVENSENLHNVVVCTLCSCYPWPVLGLPPAWYKSSAYRARVVREPRAVLDEFGLSFPKDVEIRVWDSTAEVRYLVIPKRPVDTDAMAADELAGLVTRDSMIGTGLALAPEAS
ncbi:MAG: nitrile hydratase subunit alpha [Alphaproteobacteria bacterium]|nr:nitrile hydratase subunit alpha [Alphaproteobacteria bacterium]HCP00428.1 nitrile hydratase subunit alpha [Rhodospirillaceae bacterium]